MSPKAWLSVAIFLALEILVVVGCRQITRG